MLTILRLPLLAAALTGCLLTSCAPTDEVLPVPTQSSDVHIAPPTHPDSTIRPPITPVGSQTPTAGNQPVARPVSHPSAEG